MISWQSIMSVFNTKGTLLKWLKTLDQSLQDGVLQSVSVNPVSTGVITLTFNFADGSTITTPQITLPEGKRGPQGVPGADGTDGSNGTDGRDALVQNRALSSANITSPMAVPIEALNRAAVVGEPIVMFATDTTENKTYMLIGTVTNVGSPGTNPYVFVTYSNKVDITGMTGPKGDPGEVPAGTVTQSTVIERPESLPTATADSPDFVEVGGVLYRKKAVEGGSLLGTWVFNDKLVDNIGKDSGQEEYNITFLCPSAFSGDCDEIHVVFSHFEGVESVSYYDNDIADFMGRAKTVYSIANENLWYKEDYKTIQITDISSLTNEAEFTSWLTANATKQGGGGGTVTYSYVALADA